MDYKAYIPPSIKTVGIPEDDCVIVEADWKQAELFVLAYLSNDKNMKSALTTAGRDLHDLTAVTAFSLTVCYADGTPAKDADLLSLAAKDLQAFEKLQKTLTYRDLRGNTLTRDQMKGGLRVASKNHNGSLAA